jgi:hypothetical protein
MAQAVQGSRDVRAWKTILAGVGAGLIAAVVAVGITAIMRARIPPPNASAGSALLAGILGGILYLWLTRITVRPAFALWIISLASATVISLLVATLPFPAGRGLPLPIPGLLVPLRQAAALVGLGRFSSGYFPKPYLPVVYAQHYATAVLISLLVPWWSRA